MRERRTIGRRLMGAAFLLLLAPMLGWWLATDYVEPALRLALDGAERALFDEARAHTRLRLAGVLVASLAIFGVFVGWARRSIVAPLESLAARAREAGAGAWRRPPEADRADEIGDLAEALDRAVGELERRAAQAQRAVADLGHELRTPLAAVRGAAEILLEEELAPAERTRFATNVLTESARLERLVSGLLDLERLRHGTLAPLQVDRIDARAIATEVAEVCAPLLARKELQVSLRGPADAAISTDPDRLRRLLFALLENAIRFSPARQPIELDFLAADGGVAIIISDRGPGVGNAIRNALFERHATSDPRGTGLGLAIAHALATSIDARLSYAHAPGGGAAFRLDLPPRPSGRV